MSYVSGEIKNSINILSGKPFQDMQKKSPQDGFGFQNYILNEMKLCSTNITLHFVNVLIIGSLHWI